MIYAWTRASRHGPPHPPPSQLTLAPSGKSDVLGYAHTKLGGALVPRPTLAPASPAITDAAGGTTPTLQPNQVILLGEEVGAGWRVKVGGDHQIYLILYAEILPGG